MDAWRKAKMSMKIRTANQTHELNRHWARLYRCAVCEMPRKEAEKLVSGFFCSKKCEREWKAYIKRKQADIRKMEERRRELIRHD